MGHARFGSFGPPAQHPEGDPIYVPELMAPQGFDWPRRDAPPGYLPGGYPALAPTPVRRKSEPLAGWVLFAVGVLTAVASLLPWAVFFGVSIDGTAGDGALTVLCAVIISIMGMVIGLRQGLLWTSVTACVFSCLVTLVALVDIADINRFVPSSPDLFSPGVVSVGPGLWLTLLGGIGGIAVSVLALVRRPAGL